MQLAVILVLVGSILIAEFLPNQPTDGAVGRCCAVVFACLFVVLFAGYGTLAVNQKFSVRQSHGSRVQSLARLLTFHLIIWTALSFGVLYALKWPQLVRGNWSFSGWILIDELIIMAPALGSLLISWAIFCNLEGTGSARRGSRHRLGYVMTHFRHYVLPALVPVVAIVLVRDLAEYFPRLVADGGEVFLYIGSLAILLIAFPWIIRLAWRTDPLPGGDLRNRLNTATREAGLRCQDVRVWNTDGRVVNAAVSGFLPWCRCLLISDGLLTRLAPHEIEAFVLHEAAHLRRFHPWWRIAALLPAATAWFVVWRVAPSLLSQPSLSICAIATIFYCVSALSWLSKVLEFDADLASCFEVSKHGGASVFAADRAQQLISALRTIDLPLPRGPRRATWLHPSSDQRIEQLLQISRRPELANGIQRRLAGIAAFLVILALLPLIVFIFTG